MPTTLATLFSIGFHGLVLAMVLYLISVGLSVTMGMMGFVNLAHGVFAMLGGYVITGLMQRHGASLPLAMVAAAAAAALVSLPIERLFYRRLYGGGELDQVLLTMGLVFISVPVAHFLRGPVQQPLELPTALNRGLSLGFAAVPAYDALLIGNPTAAAVTAAARSPLTGSPQPLAARMPAV
jgi:branched-chain amino acid transport system permease protein